VSPPGDEDAAVGRELDELGERIGETLDAGRGGELARDALHLTGEALDGQTFERLHAPRLRMGAPFVSAAARCGRVTEDTPCRRQQGQRRSGSECGDVCDRLQREADREQDDAKRATPNLPRRRLANHRSETLTEVEHFALYLGKLLAEPICELARRCHAPLGLPVEPRVKFRDLALKSRDTLLHRRHGRVAATLNRDPSNRAVVLDRRRELDELILPSERVATSTSAAPGRSSAPRPASSGTGSPPRRPPGTRAGAPRPSNGWSSSSPRRSATATPRRACPTSTSYGRSGTRCWMRTRTGRSYLIALLEVDARAIENLADSLWLDERGLRGPDEP
jgi:hypothetical protein